MQNNTQSHPGKAFLETSALQAYGIWVMMILFPLVLAGVISVIDESRTVYTLMLSTIAIAIIAASYSLRFYLLRNTQSRRSALLHAENREQVIKIITGGFGWWLITLISAIIAVIFSSRLF